MMTSCFRAYESLSDSCTLLTLMTLFVLVFQMRSVWRIKAEGHMPSTMGIRLDSGDLAYLTKRKPVTAMKSGSWCSDRCFWRPWWESDHSWAKSQVPITSWGVGTKLITSADCPAFGGVYKLAASAKRCWWYEDQNLLLRSPARSQILK